MENVGGVVEKSGSVGQWCDFRRKISVTCAQQLGLIFTNLNKRYIAPKSFTFIRHNCTIIFLRLYPAAQYLQALHFIFHYKLTFHETNILNNWKIISCVGFPKISKHFHYSVIIYRLQTRKKRTENLLSNSQNDIRTLGSSSQPVTWC